MARPADRLAIWKSIWSAPDAHVRLKGTDHAFVARYCVKRADLDKMMARRNIKATVRVKTTSGDYVHKPNAEYNQMLALARDVSADETLMGLNPRARLDINHRLMNVSRPGDAKPSVPSAASSAETVTPTSATKIPPKPSSPVGMLGISPAPSTARKH